MKVVIDIEANALKNPTKVWLIVCKDVDTGEYHVFRRPSEDPSEALRFLDFATGVDHWIGHNVLGYDWPVLSDLLGLEVPEFHRLCTDTLIISKLVDYPRQGHSVEDYGLEFGLEKGKFSDWSKYSEEMERYCIRDVDITHRIYNKYSRYINNPLRNPSILLEQHFQLVCNDLEKNGFAFNTAKAQQLLTKVTTELDTLDKDILSSFPPREVLIREFTPKATKFGTINRSSVPRALLERISEFEVGKTYQHTKQEAFNPSSHKQIITVLNEAGWRPVEKTKTHIDTERSINSGKFDNGLTEANAYAKLEILKKVGWKVNENNLETLPSSAPLSARSLAKRILLESRRRTLTEWLSLVDQPTARIHGKFYGIGAWTHRMAHQAPNTANIPNEFDTSGKRKLLGKELRSLWCAPRNRLLVGVDAEGIQLRIFAHYINDPAFTEALINGKKEDKSDPHSLNQSILGDVCKTRQAAKRFIYALLLGAGQNKLREILECNEQDAREAYDRLLGRYTGFAYLKEKVIPADAKRGWFLGLDGRAVRIPGDSVGTRRHLCMSGYLQNGEAVVVKDTTMRTLNRMSREDYEGLLVNVVHDEVIIEVPNDVRRAEYVGQIFCEEIINVGKDLNLKCPLAGDAHVGLNWYEIH